MLFFNSSIFPKRQTIFSLIELKMYMLYYAPKSYFSIIPSSPLGTFFPKNFHCYVIIIFFFHLRMDSERIRANVSICINICAEFSVKCYNNHRMIPSFFNTCIAYRKMNLLCVCCVYMLSYSAMSNSLRPHGL